MIDRQVLNYEIYPSCSEYNCRQTDRKVRFMPVKSIRFFSSNNSNHYWAEYDQTKNVGYG